MLHAVVIQHFEAFCRVAVAGEPEGTEVSVIPQTLLHWGDLGSQLLLQLNVVAALDDRKDVFPHVF
jgi:hypothetical protein